MDLRDSIEAGLTGTPVNDWALAALRGAAATIQEVLGIADARVRIVPGVMTAYGLQYRVRLEVPSLADYTDTLFRAYVNADGVTLDTDGDLRSVCRDAAALQADIADAFGAGSELSQRLSQIRAMARAA